MLEQRRRSLTMLAIALAIMGGLTAVIVFVVFALRPAASLSYTNVLLAAALIGTITVVYFLTLHQILSRRYLSQSTFVLGFISAVNLALVTAATGGLNSPYYALWIIAVMIAGFFGRRAVAITVTITLVYYLTELLVAGPDLAYIREHLIQLALTLIAGGLAYWIAGQNRATGPGTAPSPLSAGQLTTNAILSSIGEGVMIIDAARKIQVFNVAAQTLTGWDEISAKNIDCTLVLQLKTVDDKELTAATDPFAEAWRKAATIVHDNFVMTSRSGRRTQLSLSISPIFNTSHQPAGAIALFRDISKEKEVERQKDEFVSTASHEMRTPVAAIEGYISLAMNSNAATIDDRARSYLEKAHDTIRHLGDLFRDLLSVTKAEEGNLAAQIEPVDVSKLLQSVVEDMQVTVTKKRLTLVYQVGAGGGRAVSPLYYVAANPERLREIVMNLIDNATKYTTEGGIKVILDGAEKEVTVSVADTGVGIAPEDISHLFQKFYRVDNSATRTIGGTGLGLYLCRRVIELFGGRIWVESKLGQGSTFRFSLPRLNQNEAERMQAIALAAANTAQATGGASPSVPPPSAA